MKALQDPRAPLGLAALVVVADRVGAVDDRARPTRCGRRCPGASTKPKAYGLLRLGQEQEVPGEGDPDGARAPGARPASAARASGDLTGSCAPDTVDLGTWCLMNAPYASTNEEIGKNNYFFATQKCVELGGYLPTAAQLIGAAPRVKLASTIDDSQLSASIDLDPTDGMKDRREMSSTLVTHRRRAIRRRLGGRHRGLAGRPASRASRTRCRCPPTRRPRRCST